jgi:hypothetical protein
MMWWRRLLAWLDEHQVRRCFHCGALVFEKDVKRGDHVVGGRVRLCMKCWVELYHPWTGMKE